MWSRAQLKDKAKFALKLNYWKVILVTFLLTIVVAGGIVTNTSIPSTSSTDYSEMFKEDDDYYEDEYYEYDEDYYYDDYDYEDDYYEEEDVDDLLLVAGIFIIVFLVVFTFIMIVTTVISFVYSGFIGNPFEVGVRRFYLKSLNGPAEVKEVAYAFDSSYKNIAKIMFLRMLYTTLWSMLFIIPGIIKGYEYKMIPYLLAENPNLTKEQAFAMSKNMMRGNKWKAFVLDLSFMGWDILSAFTIGILTMFYVGPYKNLSYAALYEQLSLIHGRPGVAYDSAQADFAGTNPYENPVSYT